jgi:hypothetical protein
MERCAVSEELAKYEREVEAKELAYEKCYHRFIDNIQENIKDAEAAIRCIRVWGEDCGVSDHDIEEAIRDIL